MEMMIINNFTVFVFDKTLCCIVNLMPMIPTLQLKLVILFLISQVIFILPKVTNKYAPHRTNGFHWARKLIIITFPVGISIPCKSEAVITTRKLVHFQPHPSFRFLKNLAVCMSKQLFNCMQ